MSEEMQASRESRRRAALSAEGWSERSDNVWAKGFNNAEWMPKCDAEYVTHAVVRDRASGVAIHDSAGSTHFDNGRLSRAFKTPRNVDMVVEVNLAEKKTAANHCRGKRQLWDPARRVSIGRPRQGLVIWRWIGPIYCLRARSARGKCRRLATVIGWH